MVKHFNVVLKMSPTHRIKFKFKICNFTNFVNFFCEIKVPKWQPLKSQNLRVLLKFFSSKPPQRIENQLPIMNLRNFFLPFLIYFTILKKFFLEFPKKSKNVFLRLI